MIGTFSTTMLVLSRLNTLSGGMLSLFTTEYKEIVKLSTVESLKSFSMILSISTNLKSPWNPLFLSEGNQLSSLISPDLTKSSTASLK